MLVLSRKKNEAIVIDPRTCPVDELGRIRIVVVEIRGDKVRLGTEANRKVSVHREEVQDEVDSRQAAPIPSVAPLAAFVPQV